MVLHQVEEQIGLAENTTSLVQRVQLVPRYLLSLQYYYHTHYVVKNVVPLPNSIICCRNPPTG